MCLLCAMADSKQHIRLLTMAGRTLDVWLTKESLVDDLKKLVFEFWKVPVDNQKLVVSNEVLLGYETILQVLGCHVPNGEPLSVMVIMTQECLTIDRCETISALVSKLASPDSVIRRNAISNLATVVDVASARELEFFVSEVDHLASNTIDRAVKRAGLEALARVSPKGHDSSISSVMRCVEAERSEFVKLTAVESLAALAPRGHEATIFAAKRLLRNPFSKQIGIMVLGEVAKEDTHGVMDLLAKFSENTNEAIRDTAMDATFSILRAS